MSFIPEGRGRHHDRAIGGAEEVGGTAIPVAQQASPCPTMGLPMVIRQLRSSRNI